MYVTVEISTHSPVGVHAPLVNWHMKSCGEKRSRLELFKKKETALHQSQKYWTRAEIICKIVPGEIYIGAWVALNERNKQDFWVFQFRVGPFYCWNPPSVVKMRQKLLTAVAGCEFWEAWPVLKCLQGVDRFISAFSWGLLSCCLQTGRVLPCSSWPVCGLCRKGSTLSCSWDQKGCGTVWHGFGSVRK